VITPYWNYTTAELLRLVESGRATPLEIEFALRLERSEVQLLECEALNHLLNNTLERCTCSQ
jgi:hypothetical protein